MSTVDIFYNALGILGALMLLFGFYRVNSGRWSNKSFWYELDNVIGALLIVIYQIRYHAYVTVVVNLIWGGVAFIGLLAFFRNVRARTKRQSARKD